MAIIKKFRIKNFKQENELLKLEKFLYLLESVNIRKFKLKFK